MPEPLIAEKLQLILESIELIDSRMKSIKAAEDFVKDDAGKTIMDSICMRFQFIGESLKKIEKHDKNFLSTNVEMDLSPVMRFRDLIAHHYEKTDYEVIYDTCKHHLPELRNKIQKAVRAIT